MWYVLTAIFALLTGFGAGWFARGRMPVRPPVKDISKYMAAVVGRDPPRPQTQSPV